VTPFETATGAVDRSDPLANQVAHFAAVIRGEASPIRRGRHALNPPRSAARAGGVN